MIQLRSYMFTLKIISLTLLGTLAFTLAEASERPRVAYTGVYLMGDKNAESRFPVYARTKEQLRDDLRVVLKQIDNQQKLPFKLIFDSNIEDIKLSLENNLSLAFLVIRDDIISESFRTPTTIINKNIVNVGLVAILYDTRKIDGKDRNTIIFSFPLVGYAQRLDGDRKVSTEEINKLFVDSAVMTIKDHLIERLATISVVDIYGEVVEVVEQKATINIGALKGLEEGQNVTFLDGDKKIFIAPIVKLDKQSAIVILPTGQAIIKKGMLVKSTNMRSSSDETYQVVNTKISSKKASMYFSPEVIGLQVSQWFSSFLSDRGGKVVLPSRIGGSWDERATATAFSIFDRSGTEHQFELPPPKYPIIIDITGVSSKITDSNDVNDICLFKSWIKLSLPTKKYEKEFDLVTSKSLIKGVQQFEEKNELFDLLYQLTAKIAKEAEI